MALVDAISKNDLVEIDKILAGSKLFLQKAVETANVEVTKSLIDAGFGFLPDDTKYPVHPEILKLVKPFAQFHPGFHRATKDVEDVSVCPYNDPKFVKGIFKKKEWKKIDYYLLNFGRIQDNVRDAPEEYPENSRFFEFGTLEIIESKFTNLSENDKEILYADCCYSARENERDPRIFIRGLDSTNYTSADLDNISLVCIREYMKHSRSTENLKSLFDNANYLLDVRKTYGQRCRWPDIPHRLMIFFEGLGDRLTPELKRRMRKHTYLQRGPEN